MTFWGALMQNVDTEKMLLEAQRFFKDEIAQHHLKNTEKLTSLSEFNVNPFTIYYLSAFAFGDTSPKSLAKTLIYPRVLGTSISTTFGSSIQTFCHRVLEAFPSVVPGMDIEFDDRVDGRHKYCQIKAGPLTINSGDPGVIMQAFKNLRNLARTNGMPINDATDCCVGVLYGTKDALNGHYGVIAKDYPIYVGKEFWYRLTGDSLFYDNLSVAFTACAEDYFSSNALDHTIDALARDIEAHPEVLSEITVMTT